MNIISASIIALILAYLIGSFPSAYLIGKLRKGVDIRQVGSRNMGAMNVFYKVGFWWGMIVLLLDIGKGALAAGAAWLIVKPVDLQLAGYIQLAAGVLAVLGHSFPIFLKFKGGKGGATCIGALLYVMPWGVPVYLAIFGILMLITRFPTLSYGVAFLGFPFLAVFLYQNTTYIIYWVVILLIPLFRYIPRVKEMHAGAGGTWKHVFVRRSLKDRL